MNGPEMKSAAGTRPLACGRLQPELRAERDEHGGHVGSRIRVREASADRAAVAHLEVTDPRCALDQSGERGATQHRCARELVPRRQRSDPELVAGAVDAAKRRAGRCPRGARAVRSGASAREEATGRPRSPSRRARRAARAPPRATTRARSRPEPRSPRALLAQRRGRGVHRFDDGLVARAAAEVAAQRVADRRRRSDPDRVRGDRAVVRIITGRAEPALEPVVLDEGVLDRMETRRRGASPSIVVTARAFRLQCEHRAALHGRARRGARCRRRTGSCRSRCALP